MNFLEEALIYRSMGWAVYPAHAISDNGYCTCGNELCPAPGKHPVGKWKRYENTLPTRQEIHKWFGSLECNIGMVTGQVSGTAVVDVDGEEGKKSLRKLNLEKTLTARTGGGGYHLFYSIDGPVNSRVGAYKGIDIRGDGGFVVLYPSFHQSGKQYNWMDPVRPISPFNSSVFKSHSYNFANSNGNKWYLDTLIGVEEGTRSISAAQLAGRYFRLGLDLEEAWILLDVWNQRNEPPLREEELKRTFMAIHRKHIQEARPKEIHTMQEIQKILEKTLS